MTAAAHTLSPALRDVLDARGSNLAQSRLLFNASAEVDSLIEEVQALPVPANTKRRLLTYCSRLLTLNTDEGEHERQAAGILDAAISAQRRAATCERQTNPFTVKGIAAKLRPGLRRVAADPDGIDYFLLCCEVRDILDQVPAQQLLTPSVRNALNGSRTRQPGHDGPYELLERIVGALQTARNAA